jgi:hypothetical protein
MPEIIKEGYLSLKEEGLRAWIWSKRYCVLRDQSLTFHRNEVKCRSLSEKKSAYKLLQAGQCIGLLFLKDIGSVTRIDLKPYCFEISAKDKTYYVSCKSDEELYSWMDEIYNVGPSYIPKRLVKTNNSIRDPPLEPLVQRILFITCMWVSIQLQEHLR